MPVTRTVAELTVIALDDGAGEFFQPRGEAFPDASPAQWAEADQRDPDAVRDGAWWLRCRCFAIRTPAGRTVLVDAGIGSADAPAKGWAPVPGRLPEELAAAGLTVSDVDTVVLTHMHTDHIGWSIGDDGRPLFPNARYVLQATEVAAIDASAPDLARWLLAPLRAADQLSTVDGPHDLGAGIALVPTPGHTPGHQSVLLRSDQENLLITGDLLVHAVQLVDPGLGYAHEDDPAAARTSRVTLLAELSARGPTILATAHLGQPFVAI